MEKKSNQRLLKKTNQFDSSKFRKVQFLGIMNFHGVATSFGSFLNAYKTSETKNSFPYEWFDSPDELIDHFHRLMCFFSRLRNCNTLEKTQSRYQNLIDGEDGG